MGAINFDAGEWLRTDEGGAAKVANPAKVDGSGTPTLAGFAALAPNPGLPPAVERGLDALARSAPPRGVDRRVWARIVADALRLRAECWCASALALGWSVHDLFAASDEPESLAVWLRGRSLTLLDADSAIAEDGPGQRAQFNRRERPAVKLLWEVR